MHARVRVGFVVLACVGLAAGGCSSSPDEAEETESSPAATGMTTSPGTASAPGTTETSATTGTAPSSDPVRVARAAAPFAETPDLVAGRGDDADDVAIHPRGFVVGTSKNGDGGLEVYDLEAARLQWLELGETNNVDLRGGTVVSSNRSDDAVDVLAFDEGGLDHERSFPVPFEPYGICLYRDTVIVTASDGDRVEQYSLAGRRLRRLGSITSHSERLRQATFTCSFESRFAMLSTSRRASFSCLRFSSSRSTASRSSSARAIGISPSYAAIS